MGHNKNYSLILMSALTYLATSASATIYANESFFAKKSFHPLFRDDHRCGPKFLVDGQISECDPNGLLHCCSSGGWCGNTKEHCLCKGCIDYSGKTNLGMFHSNKRCGSNYPINGKPSICNPDSNIPCCSPSGWCGNSQHHCSCRGCVDYSKKKRAPIRADFRCGGNFPVGGKPSICGGRYPCCSDEGWCGKGYKECHCITCTDYRKQVRSDKRCGSAYPINGDTAICDSTSKTPCCSPGGWCGFTTAHCHCANCVNYAVSG